MTDRSAEYFVRRAGRATRARRAAAARGSARTSFNARVHCAPLARNAIHCQFNEARARGGVGVAARRGASRRPVPLFNSANSPSNSAESCWRADCFSTELNVPVSPHFSLSVSLSLLFRLSGHIKAADAKRKWSRLLNADPRARRDLNRHSRVIKRRRQF